MVPLPPVGANPALAKRWQTYLQPESNLRPSDFGASTWAQVQPSGRPAPACDRGDAASPSCASGSLPARRRLYARGAAVLVPSQMGLAGAHVQLGR